LIAEFVGDEWKEMRAIFYRSMRAIEHALSARREYLTKDGQMIHNRFSRPNNPAFRAVDRSSPVSVWSSAQLS
jgi:hypothetical protein